MWVLDAYILCSIIELLCFPSLANAFGLLFSFIGILLSWQVLCHTYKLLYFPVSTIALLFYCLSFEILPLLVTLLEFKPITYNLRNPYYTFANLLFLQVVLLLIHSVYVYLVGKRNFVRNILQKVNFFTNFSSQEIWFLIIGSLVWYAYVMLTKGLYTEDNLNVNSGFSVVEWAISLFFSSYYQVVFIFYFKKFNNIKGHYTIHHLAIFVIAILVFIIGVGTNMRTAAVVAFANGIFSLFAYLLIFPEEQESFFKPQYVAVFLILAIFFIGPFRYISEAMVAVRNERSGQTAVSVLSKTIGSAQIDDKTSLIEKRLGSLAWDERYISNPIFNRYCSLKILDETLFHACRLNSADRHTMRLCLYLKILDQVPGKLKRALGISHSTAEREYSLSDMLHYLSTRGRYDLGGIKIGSLPGLGYALLGPWYALLLIPLYFAVFYLLDSITLYQNGRLIFPLLLFASMIDYFAIFNDRHFYLYEFRFIFRGFWETVIFYLISINIVKRLPFLKH